MSTTNRAPKRKTAIRYEPLSPIGQALVEKHLYKIAPKATRR